jgi:NAD(P)-dependent dehydrogenase (short-subunit alcohol dehydrogenase family)
LFIEDRVGSKYQMTRSKKNSMAKLLLGKTAIITGGSSGIGAAAATLFSREGANVIVSDVNEKAGNDLVSAITQSGGSAVFVKADVGIASDCEALVQQTVKHFGKLDIAFNNAGIGGEINSVSEMSVEGWLKVINVNLNSVFYCMKYQIPAMLNAGKGAIVNMSSILGQVGFAGSAAYVAAKHGVVGLTQTAALEFSAKGIRVNAIGPAFINTPLLSGLDNEVKQTLVKAHAIGRLGESNEVAEFAAWLASDKASFVTGGYYAIDGAYLAQ